MASFSSYCLYKYTFVHVLLIILTQSTTKHAMGCFTSIISFGDSLADTGNILRLSHSDKPLPFGLPPYGQTFFHRPTGRCSDGRLVIDFIAEYLGLPLVPAYFGGGNTSVGANFAVVGATALDNSFFEERGIHNPATNISLGIQLGWFKELLSSLCPTPSNCNEILRNSLVVMGEIGGNDYNHAFLSGISGEEVQSFVPPVVNAITSAIKELIELGAVTLMVPGNLPIGCLTAYLTYYKSSNKEDYDPISGCLNWFNKLSEYHNEMLQIELNQIQKLHPQATIIYADYYNAAMRLFRDPTKFGFTGGALKVCCGAGGSYNYNSSVACGYPPSSACDDPFSHVNWDGHHLTEAAYKWISKGLLEGPFTTPDFNSLCVSRAVSA